MTTQTQNQAVEHEAAALEAAQKVTAELEAAQKLAAEQAIAKRRDANMRQATADQSLSLLDTLADFRLLFPSVAEVTAVVTTNGGLKPTGKETQNTTLLLYITMLGADTFNALFDSTPISKADYDSLTAKELEHKRAKHSLTVYRAMLVVDKNAAHIAATAKFTRTLTAK